MEEELISKKELLDLTGISYGQLYRWKRKDLIPEEWFIRKSTFTGQETFFPKSKILPRIERIQNMKDGLSLDEIADSFSPTPNITRSAEELAKTGIAADFVLDYFVKRHPEKRAFAFTDILCLFVLNQLLKSGDVHLGEADVILDGLEAHYPAFQGKNCELMLIRKLGVAVCVLLASPMEAYVDKSAKIVARVNIASAAEELRVQVLSWEG